MSFCIVPLLVLLFALFAYYLHAIGLFTILFWLFIYYFAAAPERIGKKGERCAM